MFYQGRSLVNTILRGTTRVPPKRRHSLLRVTVQGRCALPGRKSLSRAPLGSELPCRVFTGGLQPVAALSGLKRPADTFSVNVFFEYSFSIAQNPRTVKPGASAFPRKSAPGKQRSYLRCTAGRVQTPVVIIPGFFSTRPLCGQSAPGRNVPPLRFCSQAWCPARPRGCCGRCCSRCSGYPASDGAAEP